MGSRRVVRWRPAVAALVAELMIAGSGAALALAWQKGMGATLFGATLAVSWLAGLRGWSVLWANPTTEAASTAIDEDTPPLRALLDQVPAPLIRVTGGRAHAINRAARTLFGTDDRIPPAPSSLLAGTDGRLLHEGRTWRMDAVDTGRGNRLAVLIDVGAEERAAEARANDEMIDILGHELLNGLSPVVSLVDSAVTAAAHGDAALPDILATLARRIEGLEGFTRAYRTLSRLPDPVRQSVPLDQLAEDLTRLFAGRFQPTVVLAIDTSPGQSAHADPNLLLQAIWALLQNGAEATLAAPPPREVSLAMAAENSVLTVEVRDTGPGVAVEDRAHIFRPFHTTKPGGSGIGLSLTRRIARLHGGDVLLLPTAATAFQMRIPDRRSGA